MFNGFYNDGPYGYLFPYSSLPYSAQHFPKPGRYVLCALYESALELEEIKTRFDSLVGVVKEGVQDAKNMVKRDPQVCAFSEFAQLQSLTNCDTLLFISHTTSHNS